VHERLTVFPYGLYMYIIEIDDSLAFQRYSQCWGLREIHKNVTVISGADRR